MGEFSALFWQIGRSLNLHTRALPGSRKGDNLWHTFWHPSKTFYGGLKRPIQVPWDLVMGALNENRTRDLFFTKEVLYR